MIIDTIEKAKLEWQEVPLGRGENLYGKKFGKLSPIYRTFDSRVSWVCRCDCGCYTKVRGDHLRDNTRNNACSNCLKFDGNKPEYIIYKYIENDKVIYIGKTERGIKTRVQEHKKDKLFAFNGDIYYHRCRNKFEMDVLEYIFINKYHPPFNEQNNYNDIQTDINELEWIHYGE